MCSSPRSGIRSEADRRPVARIFTASMADIVFLLIVFFVVTYQREPDRTPVRLPETMVRAEVPKEAALISIASPADGEIIRVSSGREPSLPVGSDEELFTFVSNQVSPRKPLPFVIKADHEVRYATFDRVLDVLKRADAREIVLLSDQKTEED